MNLFNKIIRTVWPLFAQDDEKQKKINADIQKKYGNKDVILDQMVHITDEDYAKQFAETAEELFEDERDRLKTIEGKAVTLLGATGLIISLIVNFTKEIKATIAESSSPIIGLIIGAIFLLTIVYFLRSTWYSLKALGRQGYHQLDVKDIMDPTLDNKIKFFKKIGSIMIASRVRNYDVINNKVEFVVTSHKYFKRGVICLVVLGFLYMFSEINLILMASLINECAEIFLKLLSMMNSLYSMLLEHIKVLAHEIFTHQR